MSRWISWHAKLHELHHSSLVGFGGLQTLFCFRNSGAPCVPPLRGALQLAEPPSAPQLFIGDIQGHHTLCHSRAFGV